MAGKKKKKNKNSDRAPVTWMMYFEAKVVRTREQFFMCERAIKSCPVGSSWAARLQIANLRSVVNQKFVASGVFRDGSDMCSCSGEPVSGFMAPRNNILSPLSWCVCVLLDVRVPRSWVRCQCLKWKFMGLCVKMNLVVCSTRVCKVSLEFLFFLQNVHLVITLCQHLLTGCREVLKNWQWSCHKSFRANELNYCPSAGSGQSRFHLFVYALPRL